MEWVHPHVRKDITQLTKDCKQGKPFPHVLIHDFLDTKFYNRLKRALLNEEFIPKSSDLFEFNQTVDLRSCADPLLREFQKLLSEKATHALIKSITGISTKGEVDGFGSHYTDTHYLLPHDDRLEKRKVAYILYCSSLDEDDGGQLDLFLSDKKDNPTKVITSYVPQENSLMLFPVTSRSWHQVREVVSDADRLAIGGWFYG